MSRGCHAPVVLSKEGPVDGLQLKTGLTKTLSVVAGVALSGQSSVSRWIRLRRTSATCRSQRSVGREVCVINDEVVDVAVSVRAASGEEIIVDVSDVIDVDAKLEGVVSG